MSADSEDDKPGLSKEDLDHLTSALREIHCCSPEEHRAQHDVLARWIENDNIKRDRREKLKTQVGGWAIIAILGGIGRATYEAFIYLKEHLR